MHEPAPRVAFARLTAPQAIRPHDSPARRRPAPDARYPASYLSDPARRYQLPFSTAAGARPETSCGYRPEYWPVVSCPPELHRRLALPDRPKGATVYSYRRRCDHLRPQTVRQGYADPAH